MAYVPIPKDLTKVRQKLILNLTKRQVICFSGGALIGVPLFFLTKNALSGSIADMDLKSLKKKYKSKGFAAGCSREVIAQGAEMLGWTLDDLLSRTLEAMKPDEAAIAAAVAAL